MHSSNEKIHSLDVTMGPLPDAAVLAVARRFPEHSAAIEKLARRNEEFRDMCDELAAAEFGLASVDNELTDRDERRRDWQSSIERLVREISLTLREANVVRLPERTDPGSGRRRG
jgi:hypothetical protein